MRRLRKAISICMPFVAFGLAICGVSRAADVAANEVAIQGMSLAGTNGIRLEIGSSAQRSGSTWHVFTREAALTPAASYQSAWHLASPDLTFTGAASSTWMDSPIDTNAGARLRYYAVGSPVDDDGDRMSSSFELLVTSTDPYRVDSDGDAMPDGWEFAHGLDPTDRSDKTGDVDVDGFANDDEFVMGSNPTKTWVTAGISAFDIVLYQPVSP